MSVALENSIRRWRYREGGLKGYPLTWRITTNIAGVVRTRRLFAYQALRPFPRVVSTEMHVSKYE